MRGVVKIEHYNVDILRDKHSIPLHKDYKEREKEIIKLLNQYSTYFLVGQKHKRKRDFKMFCRNWIGVKITGKKYPDQSMKISLNSMSNYLINSQDYLQKRDVEELIRLEHIKWNDNKYVETDLHKELKAKCLFVDVHKHKNKQNYIFMINEKYENEVLIHDTDRFNLVQEIKNEAVKTYGHLKDLIKENSLLKEKIKEKYLSIRHTKDDNLMSDIVHLSKKLKENQEEVKFLKYKLLNLIDDYNIETHQFFN